MNHQGQRVLLIGNITDMRDGATEAEDFLNNELSLRWLNSDNPPDAEGGYFTWYFPRREDIERLTKSELTFDTLIFISPRTTTRQEDTYALAKDDCVAMLLYTLTLLNEAQPGTLKKVGVIGPWRRANKRRICKNQCDLLSTHLDGAGPDFFVDGEKPTNGTMPNLWEKLWG